MKKKQLTAAIMTALMAVSASAYAAEQTDAHEGGMTDTYDLAPVEVEGQRAPEKGNMTAETASLGALGGANVLEAPVNVTSYTEETLKKSFVPTRGFLNAATNNPSVMVGGASTSQPPTQAAIISPTASTGDSASARIRSTACASMRRPTPAARP